MVTCPDTDGSQDDNEGDEGVDAESASTGAQRSTVIMEQSIVDWGTRRRTRAKLTLRIGHLDSGEVDVEVRSRTCVHICVFGMRSRQMCVLGGGDQGAGWATTQHRIWSMFAN